jgi:hypothetical protein
MDKFYIKKIKDHSRLNKWYHKNYKDIPDYLDQNNFKYITINMFHSKEVYYWYKFGNFPKKYIEHNLKNILYKFLSLIQNKIQLSKYQNIKNPIKIYFIKYHMIYNYFKVRN